ncbi:unnamed protein product [Adineta steineri]|uniref:Uncharacterized protein n=1 Tax=Adineta steineri TaxID=433720 RepID=A0A814MXV5_9BILA|nr:unnamed protein product [Adineta steineri]CAF1207861.1 unnamed protein product [Adineta steineri]CAF1219015.1 unnamed protein product [Adineta steineri]
MNQKVYLAVVLVLMVTICIVRGEEKGMNQAAKPNSLLRHVLSKGHSSCPPDCDFETCGNNNPRCYNNPDCCPYCLHHNYKLCSLNAVCCHRAGQ